MRVDRITGVFQCFSCAHKGNLFTYFEEKPNYLQLQRELLKKNIQKKRAESIGLAFPQSSVPYEGTWRNIKSSTYKLFEAFECVHKDFIGRINFPVRDRSGRIVAFNGRHTTGGTPKYMTNPAKAKLPLFPIVEPILGNVILVEGIYDMLNLHDKGLTNAMCCFGTSNINVNKLKLLSIQGVSSVDIFFDGDEPGQLAAENVKELCEEAQLLSRNIFMQGTDPGELLEPQVQKLKHNLYS
jgi:DNA primase